MGVALPMNGRRDGNAGKKKPGLREELRAGKAKQIAGAVPLIEKLIREHRKEIKGLKVLRKNPMTMIKEQPKLRMRITMLETRIQKFMAIYTDIVGWARSDRFWQNLEGV